MPNDDHPIDPQFSSKRLSDATVQEIELELLRRSVVGEYKVAAEFINILLENRRLWRGLIVDRLGVNEGGHWLQPMAMIKLRDIEQNFWNADTVYVLCSGSAAADELLAKLSMEKFGCMPVKDDDPEIVQSALGGGRDEGAVILRFWWD